MNRQALIVSAFCGTGKTYLYEKSSKAVIELECWKYDTSKFPENYLSDIKLQLGKVDVILISTNPIVLNSLINMGLEVKLIYPELSLKAEYINRYRNRGSASDFILTLSKYWDTWLKEIGKLRNCQHFVLKHGEYIADVL